MPRVSADYIPIYRKHRSSGQGIVLIDGRTHYLGKYGSKTSRDAYDTLIAEWTASGRRALDDHGLSVNEVLVAFLKHATKYYKRADGSNPEMGHYKRVFRIVKKLYGTMAANDFGPRQLSTIRENMIPFGWVRKSINCHLGRIKRVFRWAGEQGLCEPSVYHGLQCVIGLRFGKSEAEESKPVKPVPQAFVDAVLPHVAPQVAAMIRLQQLTGMRPGEAVQMRTIDLETTGRVWQYRPMHHKTQHFGREREIYLGPLAQEIIKPWLRPNLEEYLFNPHEAREARFRQMRAKRQTKVQPSQVCRKQRKPKKIPGNRWTESSYRRAIQSACIKAGVPVWYPNQLRHNSATNLRREHGIELARIILGHSTAFTTEIYAEADKAQAIEVIAKIG
jgi:integrase